MVVLCGKGNNGGDGLVAARLLHEQGCRCAWCCPSPPDEPVPDARAMYRRAVAAGVPIAETVTDETLADAGVVIDALLGTGVTGPVRGVMGELIERTNALRDGRGVLAVDLPSGVDTDTGQVYGPAIQAEVTVTMALPKPCLVLYPGAELAGRWTGGGYRLPARSGGRLAGGGGNHRARAGRRLGAARPPTAHKGSVGETLIIAGSFGMTGAAAMACALRLSQRRRAGAAGAARLAGAGAECGADRSGLPPDAGNPRRHA